MYNRNGVAIFGLHDENTLEQLDEASQNCARAALMADGHLGYHIPIGGVVAYYNQINVAGVGVDIACGNAAIKTDLTLSDIYDQRGDLADQIFRTIEFGAGKNNNDPDAPKDDPLFDDPRFETLPVVDRQRLRDKAQAQVGTVGSGNHYVDVFSDEDDIVWVGVHFGSRGFGYAISNGFTQLSAGKDFDNRKGLYNQVALLNLDDALGHDYWNAMQLAGDYAYLAREWVARKIVAILGGQEVELIHNHHNFAWKEKHQGVDLIVVRKGATPAWPGQKGFVGGSMGDNAVILEGADLPLGRRTQQIAAMFSTVHGAGRVMSRKQAKRDVTPAEMKAWIDNKDVVLRGAGLDESPQAYRRLPDVLQDQGDTVTILHTLRPQIVCMENPSEGFRKRKRKMTIPITRQDLGG